LSGATVLPVDGEGVAQVSDAGCYRDPANGKARRRDTRLFR
jgi:hypothetical protein